MDGRHHPRRNPSFDAGDEQFFNYGSTVDYGGYSHRRGQHSNASAYDRPPRTPEHAEYDYSQYAAARLALSPHFGEGYDSETRYYPDGVHHAQRPSVSQSINSYSSNVPSPPPHREYPPVPPPHRSQPSFRQHQSQFPITDTISERPAEELSSLHHTPSQASGYQPRALPPTPDDPVEEKDNDFDSVLDNISWMPSPPPRSITSGSVEDPELVLYRPSSSHLNDRDASLRSIDPISRHGSSGRASINRNYSSASRVYDNRSSGTMMAAEEPAAPFTISGYAPEDEEETPADYGDTDDSLLDAYDDMSILSPPPLVTRPPQANNPSPTAPSVHLDFGNPQSNQHENMRDAEPAVNIGFLDYYDDLENFVRPLPIPPGRSLSATTRPTLPRPEAAIPRRRTNASGIPSRERHSLIETSTSPLLSFDLPAIPFGRQGQLEPSRVSKTQFDQCTEPWALSSVVTWLKSLASKVTEVSRGGLVKILILLYQYKVPTTALLEIEELAEDIVDRMLASGVLEGEEQELRFTSVSLSGVLPQFTGSGCYSLNSHVSSNKAMAHKRCYSSLCGRQKRHALLYTNFDLLWHEHYKIDMAEIPPNEVRFQNTVRDLLRFVYTIWDLVDFLNNVVTLYLRERDPCLTLSMEKEQAGKFVQDVFGHFPDTAKALKEYLLLPLREREAQQGPYVKKISDILLRFIKRSRTAFLNDIAARGRANFLFSRQREIDGRFRKFATNVLRKDKIGWEQMVATTVKFTTGCLATLDALAKTCPDPEEKAQIQVAIQEWNELTKQINAKQAESEHTGHPRALASMLTISNKVPFEKEHLLLQERMRQVLFQNDLNRQSSSTVKFGQMTRIKGILLDNYMLFAKQKFLRGNDENTSSTAFDYIVDRLPIPMRMLALEWPNDDVVFKNTRASNPATRSQSHHLVTISGMPTAGQTPPISTTVESQDRSYFPFTIKHLGKESHEVFASSKILRQSWCNHIKQALQNHVKAARSTEPFRLRVLADNSFVYSQDQSSSARRLHVEGTALWDALREVEAKYPESRSRGSPVARGNCLCSTVFTDNDGALRIYIGTTSGLYISDYDNPRGWQKISEVNGQVEQVAVIEEFRLVITLGDGHLYAWEMGTTDNPTSSSLQFPEPLSQESPFLFSVGRMDGRLLVAYAKRVQMGSSVIKYTEPVLRQSMPFRRHLLRGRRAVEHFRKYDGDTPYANGNLVDATMFSKSIALVMHNEIKLGCGLGKVKMFSVPYQDDTKTTPETADIMNLIRQSEARAIFRLDGNDFLLVYNKCAVRIDKHAQITRYQPYTFAGIINTARLYRNYLILFYDDFVEIQNAIDGRQRQIISGRNIRLLDDRGMYDNGSDPDDSMNHRLHEATVKICMQHPEEPRNQLIVELVEA